MAKDAVRVLVSLALSFGCLDAAAQTEPVGGWFSRQGIDRGSYLCGAALNCEMQLPGEPIGGGNGTMLESVINDRLNDPIWRKNDFFSICNAPDSNGNGGGGTTFIYDGIGGFKASANPSSPPGGGYHGDTASKRFLRSGDQYSPECSVNAVVQGHYEWYDYYSDNVYVGSGDLSWVVDQVSVFHQCV